MALTSISCTQHYPQVQTTGRSLWAALTTVPTATRTGGLLRGEPVCSHSEVPYQEL